MRAFAAPAVLGFTLMLAGTASATPSYTGCVVDSFQDCLSVFSQGMNFYFGAAQLLAPGGGLISTTTGITVDVPPGPGLAGQIAADPFVPTFVATHAGSLIGNTDLSELAELALNPDTIGLASLFTALGLTVNPVSVPSAPADLFTLLTAQPAPFTISSDTGYVPVFDNQYFTGPLGPYDLNSVHYSFEGVTAVNFFERDLVLTESAPEPGAASMVALGMALACAGLRWRSSSASS